MSTLGHPCFDAAARHTSARVHLPVAPRCNLQCRYCNRQTDCLHESRPGVTSGVLTPEEALSYLDEVRRRLPTLKVVGIAGPGDPMANAPETLETLRLVKRHHPDLLLCLATNGLNLVPHLDELAALGVSHVTVTVNAVDPEVGRTVYDWMKYDRRTHQGIEAARHLWDQQVRSLEGLVARGITAKVNTLLIPGINDHHVEEVARTVAGLGASFFNLIPLYPVAGTPFGVLKEPTADQVKSARDACGRHLPQMAHCQRCRADAAGLLGHDLPEVARLLEEAKARKGLRTAAPAPEEATGEASCSPSKCASGCAAAPTCASAHRSAESPGPRGRRAAVATLEGALVNLHLGHAPYFLVYEQQDEGWRVVETRPAPPAGGGDDRWLALAEVLAGCEAVFVAGAGARPIQLLGAAGLEVFTVDGLIDDLLGAWGRGEPLGAYLHREAHACGAGCRGTGGGCG